MEGNTVYAEMGILVYRQDIVELLIPMILASQVCDVSEAAEIF